MEKVEELKKLFDKASKEVANGYPVSFYDTNFFTQIYIKMFNEYPHLISLDSDGYYLNPEAADIVDYEDDDSDEYNEKEEEKIYTFDSVFVQKTFISLVEYLHEDAYVIRHDQYPIIICEKFGYKFIIAWNDYYRNINVYIDSDTLPNEIASAVIDRKLDDDEQRWFSYVTSTANGFNETSMKVKKQEVDIKMNYNDDLPHDKIVEFLKSNKSGLVLLHGDPGTGKTTYIRHLMYEIKGRPFIVLDASVFAYITDASFIQLLLDNKNAVIILEDCETMLTDRVSTGNQMLSTLLNLSDGIIGDSFNFKFICTFNAEIGKLDKAIQRKGRMKVKYEFKNLNSEKTAALAKSLGIEIKEGESLPLSEIFNYGISNGSEKSGTKKIGFSK